MEENPRQRVSDAGVGGQQVTAVTPTSEQEDCVLSPVRRSENLATVSNVVHLSYQQNSVLNVSEMSVYNNENEESAGTDPTLSSYKVQDSMTYDSTANECDKSEDKDSHSHNLVLTGNEIHILEASEEISVLPLVNETTNSLVLAEENNQPAVTDELDLKERTLPEDSVNKEQNVDDGDQNADEPMDSNSGPVHSFAQLPREITGAWEEFTSGNGECFTKGCKWSPDGTCLLTNSDDCVLRIFDLPAELHCQSAWPRERKLPEMRPALRMKEGGLVYDYCWYPLMSSWDPLSCCLVSTAQDSPVHMWDAFTGTLRATYRAYNQVDEVEAAHCVAFDPRGEKLYCGFKNVVRVFNTALPGRDCETRRLKDVSVSEPQRGIVSCISVNPGMSNIYAIGTYLKSVGLYCEPRGAALCLATGHAGGVTHLAFSPDGTKLYSGARKDPEIVCWDIRNPGTLLYTLRRQVSTNQRITFDLTPDGRHLLSGQSDGRVAVWDLLESPVADVSGGDPVLPTCQTFAAHDDCANGVSVHQQYPIVATSSGQRHFAELSRESSDSEAESPLLKRRYIRRENAVKLWWTAG